MEENEFKAKIVDGQLHIEARCRQVPNANGGFDVICEAPSLQLIADFREKLAEQGLING